LANQQQVGKDYIRVCVILWKKRIKQSKERMDKMR